MALCETRCKSRRTVICEGTPSTVIDPPPSQHPSVCSPTYNVSSPTYNVCSPTYNLCSPTYNVRPPTYNVRPSTYNVPLLDDAFRMALEQTLKKYIWTCTMNPVHKPLHNAFPLFSPPPL